MWWGLRVAIVFVAGMVLLVFVSFSRKFTRFHIFPAARDHVSSSSSNCRGRGQQHSSAGFCLKRTRVSCLFVHDLSCASTLRPLRHASLFSHLKPFFAANGPSVVVKHIGTRRQVHLFASRGAMLSNV